MNERPTPGGDRPIERLLARPLGEAALDRNTESVARRPAAADAAGETLIFFSRSGELFALPAVSALRAFAPLPVHRVPHRPGPLFRGVASERGELRLVGSLEAALDLAPSGSAPAAALPSSGTRAGSPAVDPTDHGAASSTSRRMLLIDADGESWLIEVDAVVGVRRSRRETWVDPPATVSQGRRRLTSHVVPLGLKRVALLDPARLVAIFRESLS